MSATGPVTVTVRDSNVSQMTHQTQDHGQGVWAKTALSHAGQGQASANQPQKRQICLQPPPAGAGFKLRGVRTKCNQIYSLTDLLMLLFSLPFTDEK